MTDLIKGDCLEVMKNIPDGSIDAIITDPPYGTTACKWDSVIPFNLMWEQLNRIIKPNGAIVLFGSEPFSSALRMSNIKNYKYDWTWKKSKPNGFQHSKNKPMKAIENVMIFSNAPMGHKSLLGDKRMKYNPQNLKQAGLKKVKECSHRGSTMGGEGLKSSRPNQVGIEYMSYTNFPSDYLEYANIIGVNAIHPTQKPTALMEYLIKTYTNENETVLDFTMGSGTTGVACKNLNRKFIGIEMDDKYFEIAKNRIL
ncbi:MAG: Flavobacterium phage vB FspS snusmum6 [Bacteroidota bacterium]|jgi:site-specific DNA-methyltransferase (adenine-specific)